MPSLSTKSSKIQTLFIYEGEGFSKLDAAFKFSLIDALLGQGYRVQTSQNAQELQAALKTNWSILGDTEQDLQRLIKLKNKSPEDVLKQLDQGLESEESNWKPWFPVIDFNRCTNCMQCLSFCLFDVYGVSDDQQIQVSEPKNCKTDCPACSRVCPEVAILFPKYRHGPINGDTVKEDDIRREKMKVDISSLLGGDIYQTLRDRSEKARSRFSKERDEDKALAERKKCLAKLKEQFDIPDEVIASLPNDEQIQAKFSQQLQRPQP